MLPEPECNAGCVAEGYPLMECAAHGISCNVPGCTLHGHHAEHNAPDRLHGNGTPRRMKVCADRNPEGDEYWPGCCRFPKSCSPTPYDETPVTEADLEPRRP